VTQAVHVNGIMFGNNPLGALERFNLYSWKALGHDVSIYACKWDTKPHTASSLGLDSKIRVVDLYELVSKTDSVATTFKKPRELLLAWLDAAKGAPPTAVNDHVYNVADLSKSYIGATRKGIVLDLKVGPSKWVDAYLDCFESHFISYTRGLNTPGGLPENQCMGTMQLSNTIRAAYQKSFEGKITALGDNYTQYRDQPTKKWFDKITGWHGNAAKDAKFLDTAKCLPTGGEAPKDKNKRRQYDVPEIRGFDPGHGPFRVFKRPDDQSNKAGAKTPQKDIQELADWVWKNEISKIADNPFKTLAKSAFDGIPKS
jgi:hypothetical protein